MIHEIDLAVIELDKAMIVAMFSIAFPLQIIGQYIYAKLTKRMYHFRNVMLLDLILFVLVGVWFERFEVYQHDENYGFGLQDPPSQF